MYKDVKINLIDTPGHADFGGEVERVVRMADGALVLVDAAEGPMPQTRFVLSKALECRLQPIVIVNKVDRSDARPLEVLDEVFNLFLELGADDKLADFPYLFGSGRGGFLSHDPEAREGDLTPLLDLVLERVPGPKVDIDAPLQMLCTTLDWSDFVGRIAIGRIQAGRIKKGQPVALMQAPVSGPEADHHDSEEELKSDRIVNGKVVQVHVFDKLGRVEVDEATAGDIAAVVGLETVEIGDTIADVENPVALSRLTVDPPTLQMVFGVNTSPFVGKSGKFLTTRHLRERLDRELEKNVALRVEPLEGTEQFIVSGRGLLHLSVLIETMRREGYELSIGKPHVILHEHNGVTEEPFESLVIEVPHEKMGPVMELIGARRGENVGDARAE